MKTLIISSSLNPGSNSFKLCEKVKNYMEKNKSQEVKFIDLRDFEISHIMKPETKDAEKLKEICKWADNYIFGMAVYNYNVNDSLASFIYNYLPKKEFHLYGIIVAAGGDYSFLATSALNQMLMTHNRMIPLPRFIYASKKDWNEVGELDKSIEERLSLFSGEFYEIGKKLLK